MNIKEWANAINRKIVKYQSQKSSRPFLKAARELVDFVELGKEFHN